MANLYITIDPITQSSSNNIKHSVEYLVDFLDKQATLTKVLLEEQYKRINIDFIKDIEVIHDLAAVSVKERFQSSSYFIMLACWVTTMETLFAQHNREPTSLFWTSGICTMRAVYNRPSLTLDDMLLTNPDTLKGSVAKSVDPSKILSAGCKPQYIYSLQNGSHPDHAQTGSKSDRKQGAPSEIAHLDRDASCVFLLIVCVYINKHNLPWNPWWFAESLVPLFRTDKLSRINLWLCRQHTYKHLLFSPDIMGQERQESSKLLGFNMNDLRELCYHPGGKVGQYVLCPPEKREHLLHQLLARYLWAIIEKDQPQKSLTNQTRKDGDRKVEQLYNTVGDFIASLNNGIFPLLWLGLS